MSAIDSLDNFNVEDELNHPTASNEMVVTAIRSIDCDTCISMSTQLREINSILREIGSHTIYA